LQSVLNKDVDNRGYEYLIKILKTGFEQLNTKKS